MTLSDRQGHSSIASRLEWDYSRDVNKARCVKVKASKPRPRPRPETCKTKTKAENAKVNFCSKCQS